MTVNTGIQALRPHVDVLLPEAGYVAVDELTTTLGRSDVVLPFAAERVAFMADLSRSLRRRARGIPEIEALAFWMRPAEIARLREQFDELGGGKILHMPRGTVFHIPPANVDTIFVYSLVLSMLTGNRNVVRLSSRSVEAAAPILETMREVVMDHPDVADSLRILTYGHDDSTTAALTEACDVRVIWGGDGTITTMRRFPLPPHATELAFADRFSLAAIDAESYSRLPGDERSLLAERFVNDTYWFDQLGCSSARLIVWVGDGDHRTLTEDFHIRVRERAEAKGYVVDTAAAIGKLGQSFRSMIDDRVAQYRWYSNTEVVLETEGFPRARGEFCGAGLFYEWMTGDLADLIPHIRREDQTLTVFGFEADALRTFATELRGRGIDRIVPFGQALQFNRIWDGYDLLQEFTRRVHLPNV